MKKDETFVKNDTGKLEWSLLPIEPVEGAVRVLMLGSKKYTPDNWQKCNSYKRYYEALVRHITSFWKGEDLDPETKESHLSHAMCCLLFLEWLRTNKPDSDDRSK